TSVTVGGAVGDVLATDFQNTSTIGSVIANANNVNSPAHFRGIVGTLYAVVITNVDIGDGLQDRTQNPLAFGGIFTSRPVGTVTGGRIRGANISGVISGAAGITSVQLTGGGSYVNAFISAANNDAFWFSSYATDNETPNTDIGTISGTGANFLRSDILAR